MGFATIEDMVGEVKSIPVFASYWKFIKNEFLKDALLLINLYMDNKGQIMFGKREKMTDELLIKKLVKKLS
jgi:hypothetical protein